MNASMTIWMFAALAILVTAAATAQVPEFPDSVAGQSVTAKSERYAATHETTLNADYALRGPVNGLVRAAIHSTTTLLQTASTKDRVDAMVEMEFPVWNPVRPFLMADGILTNDLDRTALLVPGLNNIATSFIGGGVRLTDGEGMSVGLAAGGVYNRQLNITNVGAGVHGDVTGRLEVSGYEVMLNGSARLYRMTPLGADNVDIDVRVSRQFDEGAYADLQGRYESASADGYQRRSDDDILLNGGQVFDAIARRVKRQFRVETLLGYPLADDWSLDVTALLTGTGFANQEVSNGLTSLARDPSPFRYDRDEFGIGSTILMRWSPKRAEMSARLEYYTNELNNIVEATGAVSETELKQERATNAVKDFVTQHLSLGFAGDYRIGRSDTFYVNTSIAIYRHDTPEPDYFDRDEQTIQGQFRYAHRFSPMLDVELAGQALLTHLVYLSGRNSNDNNWNRIFKIEPTVRYNLPGLLRNDLAASVVANYTQYDFEEFSQNIRGISYRELRLRDSLAVAIIPTLWFSALGDIRISDRSNFSWTQFAESPFERMRSEALDLGLTTSSIENMTVGVGGQLSRVKIFRANRDGSLEPFSDRTSVGPTARLEIHLSERNSVSFTGWWEHRFEESRLVTKVPWMFLTVEMGL